MVLWRSWYSWKHGTIHRLVWHSGQWYLVLRRNIRPCASIVFQQKLQPSAGPGRITGQCCDRFSIETSRSKCYQIEIRLHFSVNIFVTDSIQISCFSISRLSTNLWRWHWTLQLFGTNTNRRQIINRHWSRQRFICGTWVMCRFVRCWWCCWSNAWWRHLFVFID